MDNCMNFTRIKSVEASIAETTETGRNLKRSLGTWDLMLMGVAVAVGAGIFSVGAKAAGSYAGPSVSLAFLLAAVTCGLAIMCYAEFASAVPVAGSAYTFTYATMGELLAWGIYLSSVFHLAGLNIPDTINILGLDVSWASVVITAIFTTLLVLGTKLSSRISAVITVIKVAVVLFVIVVGAFFLNPQNYTPFIPPAQPTPGGADNVWGQSLLAFVTGAPPTQYGIFGLLAGGALVFFAFIGFDVVATSAEEVKNPQRVMPRGIFAGLAIVTTLYIAVTLVLTGMVPYTVLAEAPNPSLATAFIAVGAGWAAQIISLGILLGLTTVLMVLLLGLARIIFAMSRDGLLPRLLSRTSDKHKTPMRTQIIAGAIVALLAGFTVVDVVLTDVVYSVS
jgi:APA family basic amino acid/polyamine antiporter